MFEATHVRKDVTFCAAVKLGIFVFLAQNKVQDPSAPAKKFDKSRLVEFFIQAAGLAYHHDAVVDIISPYGAVSHHALACIFLSA